jgi:hypothetical protein
MKRDVKYCLQYMFGLHSFRYKAAKTRNTVPKEVEFYTDTLYNLIGDGRNLVYYIQGLSEKLGGGGGGGANFYVGGPIVTKNVLALFGTLNHRFSRLIQRLHSKPQQVQLQTGFSRTLPNHKTHVFNL